MYKLNLDPLCEFPKCDRGANEVHHIIRLNEEFPYFENATNLDNLRSLCSKCHGKISSMENKGLEQQAKDIFKKQGE